MIEQSSSTCKKGKGTKKSLNLKSLKLQGRPYDPEKSHFICLYVSPIHGTSEAWDQRSARFFAIRGDFSNSGVTTYLLEKRNSPYLCIYIGTELQKTLYRFFQPPGGCQMQGGLTISGLFLSFSISTGLSGTIHITTTERKGSRKRQALRAMFPPH